MWKQFIIFINEKFYIFIITLTLCLLLITGAVLFYRSEENSIRQQKQREIESIANLKTGQLEQWIKQRIGDARLTSESPFFIENIQFYLNNKKDPVIKNKIKLRLEVNKINYNYKNIMLFSPKGKLLLYTGKETEEHIQILRSTIARTATEKEIQFTDFYTCPLHNDIHYDILVPVKNKKNIILTILLFRIDPNDYLYPLIQSWPVPSKTAETLIIRKDKDSVLFLNELRMKKNTALSFRIPLSKTDMIAVQAVQGHTGIFEGNDYRGEKVLSYIKQVHGTNWFMISKIDKSEIYSELYFRAVLIIMFTIILIALTGAGFFLKYNSKQKDILQQLLNNEIILRKNQEEHKTVLYSIGDAVITTDKNGNINRMNIVAEKLTGWTESECKGLPLDRIFSIINEETRGTVENPALRVLKEGTIVGLANHTLLISKDGKEIPIADSGAPIKNERDEITGVVLVFRDQTEERESRKAIIESENKYKTLVENLPQKIFFKDNNSVYVSVNKNYARDLKIDPDDFTGKTDYDFFPEELADKYRADDRRVMDSGRTDEIEEKYIHEGREVWVQTLKTPVKDNKGNTKGILGVFRDITEHKQAADTIRRNTFELSLRNQIANIFLTALDEEIYTKVLEILLNAFESEFGVFGYIDDTGALIMPGITSHIREQYGIDNKDIIFPRNKWGDSIWSEVIRQKCILYSNEPSQLTPEGRIRIERNLAVPLLHRGEVIGLFQIANKISDYNEYDITLSQTLANTIAPILASRLAQGREEVKRRIAETSLLERSAELERSNKELEQFAYIASHDLQEPLRMVSSYTQLLAKRYVDKIDQDANDFINFAVDGANRMQRLINDLLEYSRVTTRGNEFTRVDLQSVLGQAIANIKFKIDETGAIVTNDDLPVVKGDEIQLVRVFQNLIDNALKFKNGNPPNVHISAKYEKEEVIISISDNGIGIDPQFFNKIFVIFQRLNNSKNYPGTGIGLAICKRTIERHGGKIWIESAVGEGSTFYFTINRG